MAHDVFISYSTEDQKIVEGLSAYLEQNAIRCFIAYRDIPKGIDWAEAITNAIENCRLMIIVFSENFNRSKQVDREITLCIEENKPILTFKIQNAAFSGTKKYYLQNLNWIDAFPNPEESFGALCNNVLQLIPEIRLKKEKEEKEKAESTKAEREKAEGAKARKHESTKAESNLTVSEKKATHKRSRRFWYYLAGGVAIISVLLIWLFLPSNKSIEEADKFLLNETTVIVDTTNIELLSQITIADSNETNPDNTTNSKPEENITASPPKENIPSPKIKEPTETNPEPKKPENKAVYTEITFTAATTLTSTSGEQFTALEGDVFKGKMEDGKVVQGNVVRDGKTVKSFFEKRNH